MQDAARQISGSRTTKWLTSQDLLVSNFFAAPLALWRRANARAQLSASRPPRWLVEFPRTAAALRAALWSANRTALWAARWWKDRRPGRPPAVAWSARRGRARWARWKATWSARRARKRTSAAWGRLAWRGLVPAASRIPWCCRICPKARPCMRQGNCPRPPTPWAMPALLTRWSRMYRCIRSPRNTRPRQPDSPLLRWTSWPPVNCKPLISFHFRSFDKETKDVKNEVDMTFYCRHFVGLFSTSESLQEACTWPLNKFINYCACLAFLWRKQLNVISTFFHSLWTNLSVMTWMTFSPGKWFPVKSHPTDWLISLLFVSSCIRALLVGPSERSPALFLFVFNEPISRPHVLPQRTKCKERASSLPLPSPSQPTTVFPPTILRATAITGSLSLSLSHFELKTLLCVSSVFYVVFSNNYARR